MNNYTTKFYEYTDPQTGQRVVKATTFYAGKRVTAYAKCDPADDYDAEFGKKLAEQRLNIKVAQKRIKSLQKKLDVCNDMQQLCTIELAQIRRRKANLEVAIGDRSVELYEQARKLTAMMADG